ncbi:CerR family C-terminal domain-containing protein [Rhizobium pusense]|uniref:TetR/AcrR family transcriptional regulator n=1 Tax=Agrobacterium pusense TaxID=648995 RepID=UPI000D198F5D|nr:CerR family C-terminal domain-containing protein [Agrobacterium pusense]MDH0912840.1 CerR family C-terminal domain-containing protein [Agrobacterium pusense]MDH1099095.1 CerR family C-terminal domain-containing protein [Agrobacterium pusense]MDH1115664.1 CerR family C-terminal domain-containing protein [Agrobacterium pusense]MDH2197439.1 CerR family C-terminal domain-containing protein [Agrobacterium pusense]
MGKTPRAQRTDGEVTYNRILEAAGELLASTGFAETTNKMIAAHAEVDLASINYHFGSRDGLYQAVLVEAHRRLVGVEALDRLAASDLTARDKLRTLIGFLVNGAAAHQFWPVRVLGRELMSPSSHLQVLQDNEVAPKLAIILDILSDITSIPADDPALIRCLASVAAPCAMLLVVGRSLSLFASRILDMPKQDVVDHLYSFSIGGLEAIRQKYEEARDPVRPQER